MYALMDIGQGILRFMNMGGEVLWVIAGLILVLWTLIFERVWFYHSQLKNDVQAALDVWAARPERQSKRARQVRERLVSVVSQKVDENRDMIKSLVALAPLFGLLGTVWGMIGVFDILAITGGGDVRSMASGVSRATIPTMAGMVAALSGVFGNTYVERIAEREKMLLEDHLTLDH